MPVTETVRDQTPRPIAPVDETVILPQSVRDAQARAEALHAEAYPTDAPAPVTPGAGDPPPTPGAGDPPPQPQPDPSLPATTPQPDPATAGHADENDQSWKHKFLSMQGRWQASQRTIGDMQEQMTQLGDELVRSQQMIRGKQPQPQQLPQTPPASDVKLITPEDETTYGSELIDFATRAARQAIAPELDEIKKENQQLRRTVNQSKQGEAIGLLAQAVPNWRAVNQSPEFKAWLSKRDVYSSRVRHEMLNEAHAAASAPRMIAFFRGFLAEAQATGQIDPQPQHEAPAPAPRQAAVPLGQLTAPGRAKPASGDTALPADKPVFTRAYIAKFYAQVRAGVYATDQAQKDRLEREIFSAQAEGRVR